MYKHIDTYTPRCISQLINRVLRIQSSQSKIAENFTSTVGLFTNRDNIHNTMYYVQYLNTHTRRITTVQSVRCSCYRLARIGRYFLETKSLLSTLFKCKLRSRYTADVFHKTLNSSDGRGEERSANVIATKVSYKNKRELKSGFTVGR